MISIKQRIEELLAEELGGRGEFVVDVPDGRVTDADYFTNIAFSLAKNRGKSPRELAPLVANEIKEVLADLVSKVEASGGFINLWVSDEVYRRETKLIMKERGRYGSSKISKGKIQLEFISANPTGPLTLANGRGGFYGDVLANLLQFTGADVEREYYVNDTGNQILTLGRSILAALDFHPTADELYKGEYVKLWAENNRTFVERKKNEPATVGERAADDLMASIRKVIEKKAGITFDRYTSERDLHKKGLVKKALQKLEVSGYTYHSEGALWLKTTAFGDDKDRVLITSDGFSTYLLADAGHYLETLKRGFKNKINVLGPDHYGYVKRIQAVAQILGFKKSEVLITQAILIKKGDEFVKMSKRKGEFVTFEDLVDEVGVDVARFFFVMVGTSSHIDFDLDLAKEKSSKNPVYYAEYAYVRAKKILAKAGVRKVKPKKKHLAGLQTAPERELMAVLARFPDVIRRSAASYEVHHLAKYALDLARSFHNFYEKERVVGEPDEKSKLVLVSAFLVILRNTFMLLGITPPEEM